MAQDNVQLENELEQKLSIDPGPVDPSVVEDNQRHSTAETPTTEAVAAETQQPPSQVNLGNSRHKVLLQKTYKDLEKELGDDLVLNANGGKALTLNGIKTVKDFLKRLSLSFINVVDTKIPFFNGLLEIFYRPNKKLRYLQSTVKFSIGPPEKALDRNLFFVYWNCEDFGAPSSIGGWKRAVLYLLVFVFKVDIIFILETRGCTWKGPLFDDILGSFDHLLLPSNESSHSPRGITMLCRKVLVSSLSNPDGNVGGCKHKADASIFTGDIEFLSIDANVQDKIYRIIAFYHFPYNNPSFTCFEELFKLLMDHIKENEDVDSLAILGDMNKTVGKTIRKKLERLGWPPILPKDWYTNVSNTTQTSQPDLILSRPGSGRQLFHKPIHPYSLLTGFLNHGDRNQEISTGLQLGENYRNHCDVIHTILRNADVNLDTDKGPKNAHYITFCEFGKDPFSHVFIKPEEDPRGGRAPDQENSLIFSVESDQSESQDPCGRQSNLYKMFPHRQYDKRSLRAVVASNTEPGPQDQPGSSSSSQAASSSAQHQPQSPSKK